MGNPCVGQTVVWYPHADINQDPYAAIVTEVKIEGVFVIYKFPKGGGVPIRETNVHHVDDQRLKDSPQVANRYGGWDTIQKAEERRWHAEEAAVERKERQRASEEARLKEKEAEVLTNPDERIRILNERGFDAEAIANELGRNLWSPEQVNKVLYAEQAEE
jgi:hypothetical protein